MLRRTLLVAVALLTAVAFTACDTVTDLGEVSLEGRWDSVGALQAETGGVMLMFNPANANGNFAGTWRRNGVTGPVINGMNQDGQVEFTLQGFHGQSVVFSGRLRDRFVMEGTLDGFELDGLAVFRLSST